jgi:hypothetical protein
MKPNTNNLARRYRAELLKRTARPGPDERTESSDFFAWVLSLPWVIERPYELAPGVRTFAVDCPPLEVRRLWLATGLGRRAGPRPHVSVIVPLEVSWAIERDGWGRRVANMSPDHVLMSVPGDATGEGDAEALVLTAYRHAMA